MTESQAPRNLTAALLVIAFAQLMVVLDTTIVNVALPSIQRALGLDATGLEWVVNAYALAFGGLLLLGGRAGDLFGRRRLLVAGVLLFAAASLAGGLATGAGWLLAARAVQGVGAAIVAPTALSSIADTFPEGAPRHRALGIYAGAAGSGGAIGLVLGALITNYLSWRWVFFVNVPIALVLAFAAPRLLAAAPGRAGRLDLPGAVSASAGLALLVYGLSRAATQSWRDSLTMGSLGAGAAVVVLFLLIERRTAEPLMPLRVFANRNRSGAYLLRAVGGSVIFSVLFFLTQIEQNVLHFSPLRAGLAFLPLGAGVIVTAQVAARLVGRAGPRLLVAVGALVLTTGLAWLSTLTAQAAYLHDIFGPLLLVSVGLGLVFFPTTVVAVSGAARHEAGLASALLNVSQQLGGSIGLAVLGTVAASVTRQRLAGARPTPALLGPAVTAGFTTTFEIAALVTLAGFVLSMVVIRGRRRPARREALVQAA